MYTLVHMRMTAVRYTYDGSEDNPRRKYETFSRYLACIHHTIVLMSVLVFTFIIIYHSFVVYKNKLI